MKKTVLRGRIMRIRKATGEEMLALWGYRDEKNAPPTARFFYRSISNGSAVFWTLDNGSEPVGELYAFLDLEDKDFANELHGGDVNTVYKYKQGYFKPSTEMSFRATASIRTLRMKNSISGSDLSGCCSPHPGQRPWRWRRPWLRTSCVPHDPSRYTPARNALRNAASHASR